MRTPTETRSAVAGPVTVVTAMDGWMDGWITAAVVSSNSGGDEAAVAMDIMRRHHGLCDEQQQRSVGGGEGAVHKCGATSGSLPAGEGTGGSSSSNGGEAAMSSSCSNGEAAVAMDIIRRHHGLCDEQQQQLQSALTFVVQTRKLNVLIDNLLTSFLVLLFLFDWCHLVFEVAFHTVFVAGILMIHAKGG